MSLGAFRVGQAVGLPTVMRGRVVGYDADGCAMVRWDESGVVTGVRPENLRPERDDSVREAREEADMGARLRAGARRGAF